MVNWFGADPWSPLCEDTPRVEVPEGILCARCERPFVEGDEGLTMPGDPGPAAFHRTCFLKSILNHDQWQAAGLVPDAHDEGWLNERTFLCRCCGLIYDARLKWWGRRGYT